MSTTGEVEDATAITALKDGITTNNAPETHSIYAEDPEPTKLDTTKTFEDTSDTVTTADVTKTTTELPTDITVVDALSEELDTKDSADTLVDVAIPSVEQSIKDTQAGDVQSVTSIPFDAAESSVSISATSDEEATTAETANVVGAVIEDVPFASEEVVSADSPASAIEPQVDIAAPGTDDEKESHVVIETTIAAEEEVDIGTEVHPEVDELAKGPALVYTEPASDVGIPVQEIQANGNQEPQRLDDLIVLSASTDETCYGLPDPVEQSAVEITSLQGLVTAEVASVVAEDGVVEPEAILEKKESVAVDEEKGVDAIVHADSPSEVYGNVLPEVTKTVESEAPSEPSGADTTPEDTHADAKTPDAVVEDPAVPVVEPGVADAKDTLSELEVEEGRSVEEERSVVVHEDEVPSTMHSIVSTQVTDAAVADTLPKDSTIAVEEIEEGDAKEHVTPPSREFVAEEVASTVGPGPAVEDVTAEHEDVSPGAISADSEQSVIAEESKAVEILGVVVEEKDEVAMEVKSEILSDPDNVETDEHVVEEKVQVPVEDSPEPTIDPNVPEETTVALVAEPASEPEVPPAAKESSPTESAAVQDEPIAAVIDEVLAPEVAIPRPISTPPADETVLTADAQVEEGVEHVAEPVRATVQLVATPEVIAEGPVSAEPTAPEPITETVVAIPEELVSIAVTQAENSSVAEQKPAKGVDVVAEAVESPTVDELSIVPIVEQDTRTSVESQASATTTDPASGNIDSVIVEKPDAVSDSVPEPVMVVFTEEPPVVDAEEAADVRTNDESPDAIPVSETPVEEAEAAAAAVFVATAMEEKSHSEAVEEPEEAIFSPQEVKVDWIPVSETIEESGPVPAEGTPQIFIQSEVAEDVNETAIQEPERPKSPWTPSYTVTTQGAGISDDAKELEELEQLSTTHLEPAILLETAPDDSAAVPELDRVPAAEEPKVLVQEATSEPTVSAEEVKSSSWPVSYSVNSQGATPLHTPQATDHEGILAVKPLSEGPIENQMAQNSAPSESVVESVNVCAPETTPAEEATLLDTNDIEHIVQLKPYIAREDVSDVHGSDLQPTVPVLQVEGNTAALADDAAPAAEPMERPWTPSYSVTRQGSSPTHSTKELEEEDTATEAPAERPWTPSYSVTRQGTSPLLSPQALVDEPVAEPALLVEEAGTLKADGPAPVLDVVIPVRTVEEIAEPSVERDVAQPNSPWAISYTVMQQGSSPLNSPAVENRDLPVHELSASDVTAVEASSVVEEATTPNGKLIEVDADVEPMVTPSITIKSDTDAAIQIPSNSEDPAGRPWTPSYSVTQQGSGTFSADETAAVTGGVRVPDSIVVSPAESPAFPVFEAAENTPKVSSKPSLARLAPVSENEALDTTSPPDLETFSPTVARTRLESTTSSRYFPGGWFSGPPKTPDETRESLDHANGEFSKTAGGDASPALEVPTNTPIDGVDEKRHKSKWCVIM